ncbi:MAG: TetR/AcrR family transcriptional regulator [Xanthobacteraceae bacterium]
MPKLAKTSRRSAAKRGAHATGVEKLSPRQQQSAARREAILSAALDEFSARGFAATRIEDIAERAGVAKGTIYLYFADKEALFQDIVRTMVVPFIATLEAMPPVDVPIRLLLERLIDRFVNEVYSTRRREVVKLVIAEVPRFPALAEFYYHAVIERAIAAVRVPIARAVARGELPDDTLLRFPQLIIAPGILSIIWNGLFERYSPLDVSAFMRAHLDILLRKGESA